jgi:hypothetical protein
MLSWSRACSGEAKIKELSASTVISPYIKWETVHSQLDASLVIIRGGHHHLFSRESNLAAPPEGDALRHTKSANYGPDNTFSSCVGASICN